MTPSRTDFSGLVDDALANPLQNNRRFDPVSQEVAEFLGVAHGQVAVKAISSVTGELRTRWGE